MPGDLKNTQPLTEDAIVEQLVKLIELCEQHGIDLDLLMNQAQLMHDGEPEIGT